MKISDCRSILSLAFVLGACSSDDTGGEGFSPTAGAADSATDGEAGADEGDADDAEAGDEAEDGDAGGPGGTDGGDGPDLPDETGQPGGSDGGGATDTDTAGGEESSGTTGEGGGEPGNEELSEPGSFDVHIEDPITITGASADRTESATICSPSQDGGATRAPGPFPLIITSPGASTSRTEYRSYCDHLASWGFVVINQNLVDNGTIPNGDHGLKRDDTLAVLDWALSDAAEISQYIDPARVGLAGHSMGGKVSMLAAAVDSRIGAVVGWDPVDANAPSLFNPPPATSAAPELMPDIQGAVAVIGETLSQAGFMACAPADENFEQFYAAANAPAIKVDLLGAVHMDWTDSGNPSVCGSALGGADGTVDHQWVKQITRILNVAWFSRYLKDDMSMDAATAVGTDGLTVETK